MEQRYVGHENQLLTARRVAYRDGMSDGVRAIELRNIRGLYATCVEDLGLNLYDFSYKGINFAFQSKNGLVSNRFFNGGCGEFPYYWPAGMLYTCGLANNGVPVTEQGIYYTEHGRIGMMPAENVSMERIPEGVTIRGSVKDSLICGYDLRLHRELFFPADGKEIAILDIVENREGIPAEYMLLYHCNVGYPLLDAGARVITGFGETRNRTPGDVPLPPCYTAGEPRNDKDELVWERRVAQTADGWGAAAVINDRLELGFYVRFQLDSLPILVHWNNLCAQDYCVGLEPANCFSLGRTEERVHGTLPVLPPYGRKEFQLRLGVLEGKAEIETFLANTMLNHQQEEII